MPTTQTLPTTAEYWRVHGRAPRGSGGSWAFQRSMTRVAFAADRYGSVVFVDGTYAQAWRAAAAAMDDAPFVAVLG